MHKRVNCGYIVKQVIISNKQCTVEPVTVCTDAITIHYDTHLVVISTVGEAIRVTVDNDEVPSFPHREPWLALEQQDSSQVRQFPYAVLLAISIK